MVELTYLMSNTDLQEAIIHTNAMIKSCTPSAHRMNKLQDHLVNLLDVQLSRSTMAKAGEAE